MSWSSPASTFFPNSGAPPSSSSPPVCISVPHVPIDAIEPLPIRLVVVMLRGMAERTADVSFTLDDGTVRLDFIG